MQAQRSVQKKQKEHPRAFQHPRWHSRSKSLKKEQKKLRSRASLSSRLAVSLLCCCCSSAFAISCACPFAWQTLEQRSTIQEQSCIHQCSSTLPCCHLRPARNRISTKRRAIREQTLLGCTNSGAVTLSSCAVKRNAQNKPAKGYQPSNRITSSHFALIFSAAYLSLQVHCSEIEQVSDAIAGKTARTCKLMMTNLP